MPSISILPNFRSNVITLYFNYIHVYLTYIYIIFIHNCCVHVWSWSLVLHFVQTMQPDTWYNILIFCYILNYCIVEAVNLPGHSILQFFISTHQSQSSQLISWKEREGTRNRSFVSQPSPTNKEEKVLKIFESFHSNYFRVNPLNWKTKLRFG
jgi:hypothetical protein